MKWANFTLFSHFGRRRRRRTTTRRRRTTTTTFFTYYSTTTPSFLPQPDPNHTTTTTHQLILTLCRKNKFSEAIRRLSQEDKDVTAIFDVLHHLHPSHPPPPAVYDSLFRFCVRRSALKEAKQVYAHARGSGFAPGVVTCNRLVTFFACSGCLDDARSVFDGMVPRDSCSWNALISGYSRNGCVAEARRVFDGMPDGDKDSFSWSSMLSGYVHCGRPLEALGLFREMQTRGSLRSSQFVVSSALAAATAVSCLRYGKEIHGHIIRTAVTLDSVVWSTLSDMYGKCGCIDSARRVFDDSMDKDVVSWTAMIGWYFDGTRIQDGLMLFSEMLRSGVWPNEFTYAGILNACSGQALEGLGKKVHGNMIRTMSHTFPFATAALIDMYSKCGSVQSAENVFKAVPKPDVVLWSSLISCYAQNGRPEVALRYFELMLESGTKPDHISFIGVLYACTHAGLVDRGLEFFHSIVNDHGLMHTSDHYACVVDLLSRAGLFGKVVAIMKKIPMKPDQFLWAALLNGCRIHENIIFARCAAEALFKIEPENPATYVTLANIYATAGMWNDVAKIRKMMGEMGVVKKPGSSWIKVKRQVHHFLAGDDSHPRTKEIYLQLEKLISKMKEEGYIPETNFVLHDVEEEQKEQNLTYHSEKLAVALGIIALPHHIPIKIFKNLRTCGDCHTTMMFISRIAQREIIVRDSSRFHHFKDGTCTCRGYW